MKILFYIISATILFSICSCRTKKMYDGEYWYDIGFYIYDCTESYYYTYLNYPESADILIDYMWERLNGVNNYKFNSFEEHLNTYEKDEFKPLEDALSFLIKEKGKISISVEDTFFMLKYQDVKCREDAIKIQMTRNYCKDKDAPGLWENSFRSHRFTAFDSVGKAIRKNNEYEEEYFALTNSIRKKYSMAYKKIDSNGDSVARHWLLKYARDGKIHSLCENDMDLYSNKFIKDLVHSLDSLLNQHKEIEEMHFITSIFYE